MILVTSESLCTNFFKIMMSVHLEMSARTGCVWTRPGHSTVSAVLRWFSTAHGDAALISTPQRVWHTHTQTDSIFFFWQFILLGYSKKKYNLVSWLLKWYFSDSLIFSLKPFSLYIPEVVDSEDDVHVDICWQQLEGDNMCAKPLSDRRTTYTECCCLHGVAWSEHCALCPRKDSGEKQESDKIVIF